jgi:molecular chaperone HtpG
MDQPEGEHTALICEHLYDLAQIANKPLSAEAMTKFIARSNEILGLLI